MIYFGNGGFTFGDLYNMPIYLRNFYLKSMNEVKKEEANAQKKANQKNKSISRANMPQGKRFGRR